LAKVERVLHEQTMAIDSPISWSSVAARSHNMPPISSVPSSVPEKHTSMTTTLKHLKPHKSPWGANMLGNLSVAPSVQAIVVDRIPVVKPQLASIIRNYAPSVMTCPENS
jgi:hypothetical protein